MNCEETRELIELFVLGELSASQEEAVKAHLAACEDCCAVSEETRSLVDEIRVTPAAVSPTLGFEFAVRQAAAQEIKAERRRFRSRRVLFGTGAAAALLMAGLMLWKLFGGAANEPGPPQTAGAAIQNAGKPVAAAAELPPEKWRYPGAQASVASLADALVVREGTVYLLSQDEATAVVAAVDGTTGRLKWRSDTPSTGYLAEDGSRIFCLANSEPQAVDLVALNASDGKVLWRYSAHRLPMGSPCRAIPLPGDRVCWTTDTTVHLLNSATGEAVWTHSIEGEGLVSSAVVRGDQLYIATGRALHCLSAASGAELWSQKFPAELNGYQRPMLAVAGERLFIAQARGFSAQLFCLSLKNREVAWHKTVPPVRHLLATKDALYVRDQKGILAVDGATGGHRWAFPAAGCGPATCADDVLHFVDTNGNGRLIALNCKTGSSVWEIPDVRSCDAFTRIGGTGYIKTSDGTVHALACADMRRF